MDERALREIPLWWKNNDLASWTHREGVYPTGGHPVSETTPPPKLRYPPLLPFPNFAKKILNITYTHKGWFGICPIYLGDIDGDCNVAARHDLLEWLMDLSEAVMSIAISVKTWHDPDYEPMFPMRITGELTPPIVKPIK